MTSIPDIWNSPTLPVLPAAVIRLINGLEQPAFRPKWVSHAISDKPRLQQWLIQAGQHPYFAAMRPVRDVDTAVQVLGLPKTVALLIYHAMRGPWHDAIEKSDDPAFIRFQQKTAVHVAVADCLENTAAGLSSGLPFLAAVCMRVGQSALLETLGEQYGSLIRLAYEEHRTMHSVEELSLGITHMELAGKLLAAWKIPESVQTAVRHQNAPIIRLLQNKGNADFALLKIVSIAGSMGEFICGPDSDAAWLRLQALTTEHLEYDDVKLSDLIGRARARGVVIAELLNIPVAGLWEDEHGVTPTGSAILRSDLLTAPIGEGTGLLADDTVTGDSAIHTHVDGSVGDEATAHVLAPASDSNVLHSGDSQLSGWDAASSTTLATPEGTPAAIGVESQIHRDPPAASAGDSMTMTAAFRDPLTRAYARPFFEELLDKELANCRRNATAVGILALDVDEFGRLNAIHGVEAGDTALRQVAVQCFGLLRQCDIFARYGGDEFVILVSQPTEKGLHQLAERIRSTVERRVEWPDRSRSVTVTIGGVLALPQRRDTNLASRLVSSALKAARRAKEQQRNSVAVHSLVNDIDKRIRRQIVPMQFSRWLVEQCRFDIAAVSRAIQCTETRHRRIGDLARHFGFLDRDRIEEILREQQQTGNRFGITAIQLGYLTETETVFLLAQQRESASTLGDTLIEQGLVTADQLTGLLREYLDFAIGQSLEKTLAAQTAGRHSS